MTIELKGVTLELARGKSNKACGINTLCTPYPNRPFKRGTYPLLARIRFSATTMAMSIEMHY